MKNRSKFFLVEMPRNIMVEGNETIEDVIGKLLFAKGKKDGDTIVVMHKDRIVCPKCKSDSVKRGRQDYGRQTFKCKNNKCSHQFVPSETLPRMRHKWMDIIKGLRYLYTEKMRLREAAENLRGDGINISHNALIGWKQNASDILRVLIRNIKAKTGDEDALIAVKSIGENMSWLNLDQTDKRVKVSFYSPKQIKKQIKRKRKPKIIEKHEKGDTVIFDTKKPIAIELNKKDRLGNKVLMALLSTSNEFETDELADMFEMDGQSVKTGIDNFKEHGSSGLIDARGRKEPWKRTPEIIGEVIFQLFLAVSENKPLDNSIIANDVNMDLKDIQKPIANSMVKNIKQEINFTGMKSRIPGILGLKKTAKKRNP